MYGIVPDYGLIGGAVGNAKYTDIYNLLINSNFENNILLEEKNLKKETENIVKKIIRI